MKNTSKTDWNRLKNMKDEDIDTSDIPELGDDFFKISAINGVRAFDFAILRRIH